MRFFWVSRYTGVSWYSRKNTWEAYVSLLSGPKGTKTSRKKRLGFYSNEDDAAKAADEAQVHHVSKCSHSTSGQPGIILGFSLKRRQKVFCFCPFFLSFQPFNCVKTPTIGAFSVAFNIAEYCHSVITFFCHWHTYDHIPHCCYNTTSFCLNAGSKGCGLPPSWRGMMSELAKLQGPSLGQRCLLGKDAFWASSCMVGYTFSASM